MLSILYEEGPVPGVRDLLRRIGQAAFAVRDRLSADTWRILNGLAVEARRSSGGLPLEQAAAMVHRLVLNLAAWNGLQMENMTRGYSWLFLDIGRRLERGTMVAKIVEVILGSGDDLQLLLEPALVITDSVITHRRRYFAEPSLGSVLDVVVWEERNPRSLAFQIAALAEHARSLPSGTSPENIGFIQNRVNLLGQRLEALRSPQAPGGPEGGAPVERAGALAEWAQGFGEISNLLTQVYFNHVAPSPS
jgi:uncharacterized alpha-E superfamily protein